MKEQFKLRKINLVFGCGGERDRPKRKLMGRIADRYCDKIYLTDDNPRSEDPKKIRRDIKSNIANNKVLEIPSRESAIKSAILDIKSNEVVIVAGKGHEVYQEYVSKKIFSDKKCIEKFHLTIFVIGQIVLSTCLENSDTECQLIYPFY